MKKVFVIIVTYKGKQWYDKCFTSLRESIVPVETIVVDNTPGEEDAEYIKEHYPEIHVIKAKENLGFGRANNIGLRYALDHGCDYVFLLNQDTWVKPDSLSIMLPIAEKHPECGIFSPMHIRADEKSLYIEIEDGSLDHANVLLSDSYFQTLKDIYHFKYVNAAAWLIPRRTLEIVGGFDPMFFVYGEDDNYLHRLEYHRLKVGLIPKAQIIHDHQESETPSVQYRQYRHRQSRLAEYLNVLNSQTPELVIRYFLRKKVMAYLSFNFQQARYFAEELRYVYKNRKGITKSRKMNVQAGRTWLDTIKQTDIKEYEI